MARTRLYFGGPRPPGDPPIPRLFMKEHTQHDVITFAIRDYANDLPGEEYGDTFTERLWRSADDIATFIGQRLDANTLGDRP
jgi:hypothetical protein